MNQQSKLQDVLRWILLLPASLLGALLAYFLIVTANTLYIGHVVFAPFRFLCHLFNEFASNAAMGAAFVYVGSRVAPAYSRQVAVILAVLGVLVSGFSLFPALMTSDYWQVWGVVALLLGCSGSAYSIVSGEVDVDP